MVMQNKALICALKVIIKKQYASNMHTNKWLVRLVAKLKSVTSF